MVVRARDLNVIRSPFMRRLLMAAVGLLGFSGAMDFVLWLRYGLMVPGFVVSAFCFAETLLILAILWLIGRLGSHSGAF
ncbi:MAG: hypothetical protein QXI39_02525 [Candidatus Bathyarchaeia archaeon]